MEVILKQEVKHLGDKHDLVKVRPGYARNYLFPKGYAIEATYSKRKEIAEIFRQRAHKEAKLHKEADKTAEALTALALKIGVKVSESGTIFGSVTAIQVAEAIRKFGYEIDRKQITLDNETNIKLLGTYSATVNLHKNVNIKINFEVVAE
ncbi:MAG: 50S ribosomal protein L9 [Bacteroidota bacterium]